MGGGGSQVIEASFFSFSLAAAASPFVVKKEWIYLFVEVVFSFLPLFLDQSLWVSRWR